MTTYFRRQIAARSVDGLKDYLSEGKVFSYRLSDVDPKYVLKLANGKHIQNYISLDATESYALPLPPNYDTTQKLHCTIKATERCKVVVVDPDLGTSTFILMASSGSTDGDHEGLLMWQGRVTSITVSVPAAFDTALINYSIWEIPDTEDPDNWRIGVQATGVVESDA